MLHTVGLCVLMVASCISIPAQFEIHPNSKQRNDYKAFGGVNGLVRQPRDATNFGQQRSEEDRKLEGPESRERKKRFFVVLRKVIVDSIKGLPGVLKEAKQMPSTSPYHKVYEKRGGFRQAETDFETLKPPTARDFIWGEGRFGKVGKKEIILESNGNSPPKVLIKTKVGEKQYSETILYNE